MSGRRTILVAVCMGLIAGATGKSGAQSGGPTPDLQGLKNLSVPGYTLKKMTPTAKGIVGLWEKSADGTQLRVEVVPKSDLAYAESRLKAVNAKVGTTGNQPEELMFRYETKGKNLGWVNYRATHHITFKTYRYWKLWNGTFVAADVSFTRGKPTFDAARGAFIAAKKAGDGSVKVMGIP